MLTIYNYTFIDKKDNKEITNENSNTQELITLCLVHNIIAGLFSTHSIVSVAVTETISRQLDISAGKSYVWILLL